ncbi:type A chloramphenicol O-acetyltransferase [Aliarcobacter butzleri]|uniref:type A chloramphenicol O-acetyltransferase n=1 Tax=Aliarcobacter butzleri TaxID=28197 RepID=UPI00263D6765|nr:type A chloramphenicol O-acetyltransferase [Aliarcobacter butzleri]MDN5054487.1 type A chloramphenicol O-acetyltransferase [Aliarcobacter butzleri]
MEYKKFDINSWNRKEHFEHYRNLQCSFSLTSEIEITTFLQYLKENKYKFYSSIIYLISKLVNLTFEFKISIKNNEIVTWDVLHPSYTIFHQKEETFSSIWSEYNDDKTIFFDEFEKDCINYENNKSLFPKFNIPENHFNISCLPWIKYSGFNLNLPHLNDYFQPIITIGKYDKNENKIVLPVTIQIHHAVCDGFHVAKFINKLQEWCNEPEKYL